MGNPVVHFEIMGKDAPALRIFYRDAFGWQVDDPIPGAANVSDYTIVRPNGDHGAGIDGGIGTSPEGYEGHVTFYIAVSDAAAALETVRRNGGTPMIGPDKVPNGPVIALFSDPGGHVVGLVEAS